LNLIDTPLYLVISIFVAFLFGIGYYFLRRLLLRVKYKNIVIDREKGI